MSKQRKPLYLAYSLDAFANCGAIGACCGLPAEKVSHGTLLLWQYVWRTKNDIVTTNHLIGFFFGTNPCEALLTFGHLEATPEGWRVKGAKDWLKVMGAQSDAGKKHSKNLKRGKRSPASAEKSPAPSRLPAENTAQAGENLPALTSSIQQPASNIQKEEEAPPPQIELGRPAPEKPPDKFATAEAFWAWAQFKRHEVGCVQERPPHPSKLGGWWSEVHLELNGDPTRLEAALYRFAEDPHWEKAKPSMPFNAFMATWRNYVPQSRTG